MVFSWIFPVCLRGTMLSSLLLLLSLASVDGAGPYIKDFNHMLIETMDKRLHDFHFYGCQCLFPGGDQIVDEIDRCCHQRTCCYRTEKTEACKDLPMRYYYTYTNGTITCVSVEGARSYLGDFDTMLIETMNRPLQNFSFYGCQCLIPRGSQIVDEIDRCCHQRFCCYRTERMKDCKDKPTLYYYTYSNGTITCDDEESGCARKFCECDWKAAMCFMSHKYSKEYKKQTAIAKCKGRRPTCKIYNSQ
ncbi:basic phospholipase A2 homolog ammodytin L-like [Anomaloglossus baeobatrachus]|uniref:basic phospholipase A2 homolog ammodytin L-like n=1 Tax=Anomaloglossus baeobatrachus TaxID=238106 RepID=UPI003F5075A6